MFFLFVVFSLKYIVDLLVGIIYQSRELNYLNMIGAQKLTTKENYTVEHVLIKKKLL